MIIFLELNAQCGTFGDGTGQRVLYREFPNVLVRAMRCIGPIRRWF